MQIAPFLKFTDRLFGPPIASLIGNIFPLRNRVGLPPRVKAILFIRPGGIGDAALLLPAISALRGIYPESAIDILAEKRNGGVFSLSQDVRRVFHYDKISELKTAMAGNYDIVIDTEQSHRMSALVGRLCRPAFALGYASNNRKLLFHDSVVYDMERHEVECFLDLLTPLGVAKPEKVRIPFVHLPIAAIARANQLLALLNGANFVTIFPGASRRQKKWGIAKFRELAVHLISIGYRIVVVGGSTERRDGEVIVSGGLGLNLAGRTNLAETAAVVDRSALFVSCDSGVLHMAVGLGKPTVSLFGPTVVAKWAPRGPDHIVISKSLPCSPCARFAHVPRCHRMVECMRTISVDEVAAAASVLLDRRPDEMRPAANSQEELF